MLERKGTRVASIISAILLSVHYLYNLFNAFENNALNNLSTVMFFVVGAVFIGIVFVGKSSNGLVLMSLSLLLLIIANKFPELSLDDVEFTAFGLLFVLMCNCKIAAINIRFFYVVACMMIPAIMSNNLIYALANFYIMKHHMFTIEILMEVISIVAFSCLGSWLYDMALINQAKLDAFLETLEEEDYDTDLDDTDYDD
ncbi:MAG: hypothetical protein MJ166_08255 [Clostridia bacterium]|nr:hypothetical protein [Clostridia bacterium]